MRSNLEASDILVKYMQNNEIEILWQSNPSLTENLLVPECIFISKLEIVTSISGELSRGKT